MHLAFLERDDACVVVLDDPNDDPIKAGFALEKVILVTLENDVLTLLELDELESA